MFFTMWIPETIYFLVTPEKQFYMFWFDMLRQVVGIICPLVLCVAGISISEKIRWYYSIIITAAAAIPMTALMIIFIR